MSLILSGTDGLSDVDGSAATPAIRGTDANTGIFFPAADTIAFSEGGVEIARFDSAGNFGLGVTPSAWGGFSSVLQQRGGGHVVADTGAFMQVGANNYYNGTNWIYTTTAPASRFVQNNGLFQWFTAASGTAGNTISFTQAMTLDASGNLGVGTTSPTRRLHVKSTDGVQTVLETTGASAGLQAFTNAGSSTVGAFDFTSSAMIFYTGAGTSGAAERMRVSAVGELLVGTTSVYSAPKMAIAFTSAVNNGLVFYQTNNSTGTFINFFSNSTTQQGSIINNNNGTVNYANASDYRLKENIVDFDENGLNLINNVKVRKFNRKEYPDATITGFIAHELAEVCPQAVCGEKDAVNEDGSIKAQSVDQSYLVPFLVKAIQEQQALILSLTARITALETPAVTPPTGTQA